MSAAVAYTAIGISMASIALNTATWWMRSGRATHHFRQESRLKWDGIEPPFLMCWVYWFGVEKWFYGKRIRDFGGTA